MKKISFLRILLLIFLSGLTFFVFFILFKNNIEYRHFTLFCVVIASLLFVVVFYLIRIRKVKAVVLTLLLIIIMNLSCILSKSMIVNYDIIDFKGYNICIEHHHSLQNEILIKKHKIIDCYVSKIIIPSNSYYDFSKENNKILITVYSKDRSIVYSLDTVNETIDEYMYKEIRR